MNLYDVGLNVLQLGEIGTWWSGWIGVRDMNLGTGLRGRWRR